MIIPNEAVFFLQIFCVGIGSLFMLRLGCSAVTAYVSLLGVLSNLLVCKEVILFGFTVTASDSLAVGLILSLNLIQEWFGREAVKKAIFTNFALLIIYLLLTQIHLWHTPAPKDIMHPHYRAILLTMPRLAVASLTSYLVVQLSDSIFYRWLSTLLQGRLFTLRNLISLSSSEFIDTLLFSFLGLYGSVSNLQDIIVFSYLVKLISIACFIPLIALIKRLVPYDAKNI